MMGMMMTIEEFSRIVYVYGAASNRWPTNLREECGEFLTHNATARILLKQQSELEKLLDQIEVPEFPELERRVLIQELPQNHGSVIDKLLDWLLPENDFGNQIWRPALIACLPLVFGILLGNYFSFGVFFEENGFEYWDDELYMLSLNDYSENLV